VPRGGTGSERAAVACASARACTLAGDQSDSQGIPLRTLAAQCAGARWASQPTPNPAHGRFAALTGVSCPSAAHCIAVGGYLGPGRTSRALIEQRRARGR
jgi:hypothetical protein